MPRDAWNPSQYERFAAERRQPFDDLRALVEPEPGMRIVDLGCGTGELTAELHEAFAARETLGIDRSAKMLERSTRFARPGLRFAPGDIAAFSADREWDLLFSNAALQWVGEHEHLVPRLAAAIAPGGQLAIQVPANFDHASHRVAAEVAAEEPFAQALEGRPARVLGVLAPEAYATLLDRCGFARQHVRLQVYGHHLASRDEVVEWVRGTLLTAYEDALPPGLFPLFLERYRERLLPRLPDTRPFFFPFKRLLLWARLPEA